MDNDLNNDPMVILARKELGAAFKSFDVDRSGVLEKN